MQPTSGYANFFNLFSQLGLEADEQAIERFIKNHHLPDGIPLDQADFWNSSQRQLIHQSLKDDADWSQACDQLAALLRH